jgi:hypothetical protein
MWGRWVSVSKVIILLLILVSAPMISFGQVSATESNINASIWPMEGGNPQQNGLTSQNISTGNGTLLWNVTLAGGIVHLTGNHFIQGTFLD